MSFETWLVLALCVLVAVGTTIYGVAGVRGLYLLVAAVERLSELQQQMLGAVRAVADGGLPDEVATRLNALEMGHQSNKMLVADAVDRVTRIANRENARRRRNGGADELIEDDEEPEVKDPAAVVELLRTAAQGEPAAPAAGGSLKERAARHLRATGR